MGLESIQGCLNNKIILVTGATGLLGMVFVEKILRVQPNVKKLYLLIRASEAKSATHRMHNEITRKELFKNLRAKWGANFESFISEKVVALPGDITYANLLANEIELKELCNEIQIILHSAATVNFDERYDVALEVNALGVLNVLSFAKMCARLEILVHVSTAYVCGEKTGPIVEDFSVIDELLKKHMKSNLAMVEKTMVEEKLKDLETKTSDEVITTTMKQLGSTRAKLYGWPNTYVFTKAMAEVFIEDSKGSIPVTIIRPTIVSSTYKEPFPGWIQGLRTVDTVINGYWKGKLTCLPMEPTSVVDMIPVDMLVNSIITAIVMKNKSSGIIYHLGTSLRNPINVSVLIDMLFRYCTKNPLVHKDGGHVKVDRLNMVNSMDTFRLFMQMRFMLPLEVVKLLNIEFDHYFRGVYLNYNQKLTLEMRLAELYEPYFLFKGIFDDTNSDGLRRMANEKYTDAELFNFDPRSINWEDYVMRIHIPGLWKHVMSKQPHSRL